MSAVTIRPATRLDLPAILDLYLQPGTFDTQVLSLDAAGQIFDRMAQYPSYSLYVAVDSGTVVGSFALLIMDNLAHQGAPSGVAEDVVVSAARRGQGIGRQMMAFAMQECRRQGCYKLALSSNLSRQDAHRFYDSLGFERHGFSFRVLFTDQDEAGEDHGSV